MDGQWSLKGMLQSGSMWAVKSYRSPSLTLASDRLFWAMDFWWTVHFDDHAVLFLRTTHFRSASKCTRNISEYNQYVWNWMVKSESKWTVILYRSWASARASDRLFKDIKFGFVYFYGRPLLWPLTSVPQDRPLWLDLTLNALGTLPSITSMFCWPIFRISSEYVFGNWY